MYIAVDIDETIADIGPGFAQYYSDKHGLNLPDRILQSGTIAEMYYYIRDNHPNVVDAVVAHYQDTPARRSVTEAYLNAVPIAGSIQSLQALSALGEIHYYTARPESLRSVTDQWLRKHGYPDGMRYLFNNTRDKLPSLIANAPRTSDVVLIDDKVSFLLSEVWPRIKEPHRQHFAPRFAAISFGSESIEAVRVAVQCSVFSYATWKEIDIHFSKEARKAQQHVPESPII